MDKSTIVSYFRNQASSGDWASLYDPKNPISYPFIQRFVKTVDLMQPISGEILDMGCGTGIMVKVVTEQGAKYTGFDLAPEMIEACNKKFSEEIIKGTVAFYLNDSSDFHTNKLFDTALGMGYIEYFENPEFGMLQSKKWLKPNGKLILSFPHKNSIDYFMVNLLMPFRKLSTLITGKKTIKPDRKMWSRAEAIELFEKHGFNDIKLVNYNVNFLHYPFTKISLNLSNKVGALIENTFFERIGILSTSFIISAIKKD